MLPDRVSNPGPLTYESGALPTALHGPAVNDVQYFCTQIGPFFHTETFVTFDFDPCFISRQITNSDLE